jgi:hypothetical protein
MKTGIRLLIITTFFLVLICHRGGPASANKKEYVFGMPNLSAMWGMSATQNYDVWNAVFKHANDESGDSWSMKQFSSVDEVVDAFCTGKVAATAVFPGIAVELIDHCGKIAPWVTFVVGKRRKTSYCFFYPKTNVVKDFSEIRSKTIIVGYEPLDLIRLREFLYTNGIDEPLWKVFKAFIKVPNVNSTLMAAAMGKADLMFNDEDSELEMKIMNPAIAAKMAHSFCTEPVYARAIIAINPRSMPPDEIERYRGVAKRFIAKMGEYAKTDPGIQQLRQIMNMVKAKFIPADAGELDIEANLYLKAKKNGWLEEAKFIQETMNKAPLGTPVEIRPTYNMCNKACKSVKDKMKCIDGCMGEK